MKTEEGLSQGSKGNVSAVKHLPGMGCLRITGGCRDGAGDGSNSKKKGCEHFLTLHQHFMLWRLKTTNSPGNNMPPLQILVLGERQQLPSLRNYKQHHSAPLPKAHVPEMPPEGL